MLEMILFLLSVTLPSAYSLEGHFVYEGQQQTLASNVESEFLTTLFTPTVQEVVFGPVHALSTQFQGDNLIQYEAQQEVRVNTLVFQKATYFEFKEFVKVSVGDPNSENYFAFIINKGSISSIDSVQITESDLVSRTHWVESTLQQKSL